VQSKLLNFFQVSCKRSVSYNLHIKYHGNILSVDNKHGKLFVMKQSEGCTFMPKCTKMRLAAGLLPDPLEELMHSQPHWGLLLRESREGVYV